MTNSKHTKRALLMSLLSIVLCLSMLIGSTFAWFTDSVTSGNNKIVAGNLSIDLVHVTADGDISLKADKDHKVFDYDLWEPGYTQVATLKVVNTGTLALKYRLDVVAVNGTVGPNNAKLADVIDVYVGPADFETTGKNFTDDVKNSADWYKAGTLSEMMADTDGSAYGVLLPAGANSTTEPVGAVTVTLALHMREEAGNEYQGLSVGDISLNLNATQYNFEEDSFGPDYDKDLMLSPEGYVLEKDEETGLIFTYGPNGKILYDASEAKIDNGTVVVPDGYVEIGNHAFVNAEGVKKVVLPETVEKIDYRAFFETELEEINLENVKEVGERAFRKCKNLQLDADDFVNLTTIGSGAFMMCDNITEANLTNAVEIGDNAFIESGLEKVTLGDKVESIGASAFRSLKITSITIPASVKTIGDFAFRDNKSLTSVTFEHTAATITVATNAFLLAQAGTQVIMVTADSALNTVVTSLTGYGTYIQLK